MFKTGDHEPGMLLSDVVGNGFSGAPEQIGPTGVKVGMIDAAIATDVVAVTAGQAPAAGTV